MVWVKILLFGIGIALAFALGFYFEELRAVEWRALVGGITGSAVIETENNESNASRVYAWTTALCGQDKRCIDVHVTFNGSNILNVAPVSNVVWHTDDWQDPRGNNPERLCVG